MLQLATTCLRKRYRRELMRRLSRKFPDGLDKVSATAARSPAKFGNHAS
jgi:hypothetical protein